MGTIPKPRPTKSVPSSCGICTTCPSMRFGSVDSIISAYRGRRSSGNVGTKGGASAQSEVRKHLRLQTEDFQNELVEANRIIEELKRENRSLRTIQKRQDVVLSKFLSENTDLQKINNDLKQKLKVNDQIDYYVKLNKDRNLEERERLAKKVEKMDLKLKHREDAIKQLELLLVEQISLKQQLKEQQKKAKAMEVQLGEALFHLEEYEKLNDLSENPLDKPSKTLKPKLKKESEEKEGSKSDLDCPKPGSRYSKSVGSSTSKPSLSSPRGVSNSKKLGSTRDNNSAPSNNAGYMQQKQLPQQQQQQKPPQQDEPLKQCKPLQSKAKEQLPENLAVEKNLMATSDPDFNEFKGADLGYTNTRDGRKSDEKSVEKCSKGHEYISYLEDLYGDENDFDDNEIDNDFEKNLITTREVSKDDILCDIYTKFYENREIGDAIIKTICRRGTTGRKL